jgi:hypothetical protein
LQYWTINFYKRPSLRYNIEYWNVSWNFSVYDHATKDKPVDLIPELNIAVAKDLVRMRVGPELCNAKILKLIRNLSS